MKNGYYLVKIETEYETIPLDIVRVEDNYYYVFGSDEVCSSEELEVLAGPFTIEELKDKLGV
jgi:hypothetical protein